MIQLTGLTKEYGAKKALDNVTATIRPGKVTGFIGPNGAGKSTTMRAVLGMLSPTSGKALINGVHYRELKSPLSEVGALLDPGAFHPGRTAQNHLRDIAATHAISAARIKEVTKITGIESVAKKRAGGFSMGMGQRLAIAAALLGDPAVLILDEPFNGLDPEGVNWLRNLVRTFAAEGKTVFLSSHLMSELANCADHVLVLGQGRVLADCPLAEFTSSKGRRTMNVRSAHHEALSDALELAGASVRNLGGGLLEVDGMEASEIFSFATAHAVPLDAVSPAEYSLEDAYMALTRDHVEYKTGDLR